METTAPASRRAARLPRILVIDDDPGHLQVVKIILTREDFSCDVALYEDAAQALAFLDSNPVDLILTDVSMPNMDGFQAFERIKANPATREIPVIFLSSFRETEHILRAFEMGAADFLGKPIISPILAARVRAILHTRELREELKARNQALEDLNRLKDEMLSICSHDLRSPLSAIDLICQFLKEALDGNTKHSKTVLVNRILNQARLARRLVNNLLDLNRIEEGKLAPIPSMFKIRDVVASCAEDEQPILQAGQIVLALELPPEHLICFGDREMIAQVVRNVLGNAIKFSRGRVGLECRFEPGAAPHQGRLMMRVSDDGPGIAAADLPGIFGKFSKLDPSTTGSGLGLFISARMVELHGGTIRARSEPGQGAVFEVSLPHTFPETALPPADAMADIHALVLSESKATGLLLESILVDAGMIHADKARETNPPGWPEGRPPDVVIVDAQALDPDRLRWLTGGLDSQRASQIKWVVIGTEAQAQGLGRWILGDSIRLDYPVNPLLYLNQLQALVRRAETPAKATGAGPGNLLGRR